MTPATTRISNERALDPADEAYYRLLGLAIIALFPALFWTGLLAVVGNALGHAPSALTLATVGAAIATFLFMSVSLLFARPA